MQAAESATPTTVDDVLRCLLGRLDAESRSQPSGSNVLSLLPPSSSSRTGPGSTVVSLDKLPDILTMLKGQPLSPDIQDTLDALNILKASSGPSIITKPASKPVAKSTPKETVSEPEVEADVEEKEQADPIIPEQTETAVKLKEEPAARPLHIPEYTADPQPELKSAGLCACPAAGQAAPLIAGNFGKSDQKATLLRVDDKEGIPAKGKIDAGNLYQGVSN